MSMNRRMSLVAQFDDLCRFTNVFTDNSSDQEFVTFVRNQDDCRKRWLEAELELQRMISLQNKDQDDRNSLEAKLKHCRNMLSQEMEKRKLVEQERDTLSNQLSLIKEILLDSNIVNDVTRQKLAFLNDTVAPSHRRIERTSTNLRTIDESAGSILSPSDIDLTEEDLDVPSRRTRNRVKRSIEERKRRPSAPPLKEDTPPKKSKINELTAIADPTDSIIATTTLTVPHDGPITASSRIETLPPRTPRQCFKPSAPIQTPELTRANLKYIDEDQSDESLVWMETGLTPRPFFHPSLRPSQPRLSVGRITIRPHDFVVKTNIKPEKCLTCDKRINFGKHALRCKDCKMICHVECKEQSPLPCTPLVRTPGAKGLVGCVVGDFAPKMPPFIPALILHCVMEVESRGLSSPGLYRVPGAEREVKDLTAKFLSGKGIPKLTKADINAVCGCIKNFLRSLKEPLVTYDLWQQFVNASMDENSGRSLNKLKILIEQLPQTNRDTLAYLVMHLQLVAKSTDCKMPASNLARVFGPTLIGYSSPEPEPAVMMQETNQQAQVIERLLQISQDYWAAFINVHTEGTDNSLPNTPEPRPAPESMLGPLTPSGSSSSLTMRAKRMLSHTPLGPREGVKIRSFKRPQKYFASPMLL